MCLTRIFHGVLDNLLIIADACIAFILRPAIFAQFISSTVITVMKKLLTDGNGEFVSAIAKAILSKIHWVGRNDYKAAMEGRNFVSKMIATYFDYFK